MLPDEATSANMVSSSNQYSQHLISKTFFKTCSVPTYSAPKHVRTKKWPTQRKRKVIHKRPSAVTHARRAKCARTNDPRLWVFFFVLYSLASSVVFFFLGRLQHVSSSKTKMSQTFCPGLVPPSLDKKLGYLFVKVLHD